MEVGINHGKTLNTKYTCMLVAGAWSSTNRNVVRGNNYKYFLCFEWTLSPTLFHSRLFSGKFIRLVARVRLRWKVDGFNWENQFTSNKWHSRVSVLVGRGMSTVWPWIGIKNRREASDDNNNKSRSVARILTGGHWPLVNNNSNLRRKCRYTTIFQFEFTFFFSSFLGSHPSRR